MATSQLHENVFMLIKRNPGKDIMELAKLGQVSDDQFDLFQSAIQDLQKIARVYYNDGYRHRDSVRAHHLPPAAPVGIEKVHQKYMGVQVHVPASTALGGGCSGCG